MKKVVADRLGKQDQTVAKLVQEAMEDTSELLGNLGQRQANLATRRQRVQSQIDALVEGLSQRIMPIKSVGVKIVELETEGATRQRDAGRGPRDRCHKSKGRQCSVIDQVSDDL